MRPPQALMAGAPAHSLRWQSEYKREFQWWPDAQQQQQQVPDEQQENGADTAALDAKARKLRAEMDVLGARARALREDRALLVNSTASNNNTPQSLSRPNTANTAGSAVTANTLPGSSASSSSFSAAFARNASMNPHPERPPAAGTVRRASTDHYQQQLASNANPNSRPVAALPGARSRGVDNDLDDGTTRLTAGASRNSAPPSIQEEYRNVWNKYGPQSPNRVKSSAASSPGRASAVLTRPYSPAPSSQASSFDIQEEMDRRYGRTSYKTSHQSSRAPSHHDDEPDTTSTPLHHVTFQQPRNPARRTSAPAPYIPQGTARLRSPPPPRARAGREEAEEEQADTPDDSSSVASLKRHAAEEHLRARAGSYQTEYQRQYRDWTGSLRRGVVGGAGGEEERGRAGGDMRGGSGGDVGFGGMGESVRAALAPVARLQQQQQAMRGGSASRGFGADMVKPVAPPAKVYAADSRRAASGMKAVGGPGKERILQYAVEPPPTWNLAQDILRRARLRRHEFAL